MPFFPEQLEQAIAAMNTGLNAMDTEIAKLSKIPVETRIELTHQIQILRDTTEYLSQSVIQYKHEQKTANELGQHVEIANTNDPRI